MSNTLSPFVFASNPPKRDWETAFTNWAQPPSDSEQERCDNAIRAVRNAIDKSDKLKSYRIKVFVQGSYRNRVNVRKDSDVDVGVMLYDGFLAQYPTGKGDANYGNVPMAYTFSAFKNDLHVALADYFGRDKVTRGNKAFDVHANTYRVDADVVPLFEFRHYLDNGKYLAGVALVPDTGRRIENYPERLLDSWPEIPLHYENGVTKNDNTSRRFKGLVRILKSLCNEMKDKGHAEAKGVPSYLLECLAWNVPDVVFAELNWSKRVQGALLHLWGNTRNAEACSSWCEVDNVKYLFRASQPWTREQAYAFINAAWDYVGVVPA